MWEPGRLRGEVEPRIEAAERPRPNRLSDAATPNTLTTTGESPASNAGPSWVRRSIQAQQRRSAAPARRADGSADASEQVEAKSPNWFTLVVIGFVVLSIVRACLQG